MKKVLTLLTILGCGLACISTSYSKTAFNNYNQKETAELKYAASEVGDIGTKLDSGIFSFKIEQRTKTPSCHTFRFSVTLNNLSSGDNYTIGTYGKTYLPGTVECDLVADQEYASAKGTSVDYREHVSVAVDRGGAGGELDPVGIVYGYESVSLYCTINCDYGLEIDFSTLNLTNIYKFTYDKTTAVATVDYSTKYYLNYEENAVNYAIGKKLPNESDMEDSIDYINTKFLGVSQNLDIYSLRAQISCNAEEFYASQKSKFYKEFQESIASGENFIKIRFSFNANSMYSLTTKDSEGNVETQLIPTYGSYINITDKGVTEINIFLNENYIHGEVIDFKILNFTYFISIWTSSKYQPVKTGVNYSEYFGEMTFRTYDIVDYENNVIYSQVEQAGFVNIELILLLSFLGLTVLYAAIVIVAYFYLKNKYKDDEFRKMDTPSYVKNAIHGYIFVTAFVMLVLFCMFRWSIFNNSVVVANNLDTWIIALGVISIIWFGYWVKYFIAQAKNTIEKRRRDRLKLNESISDDGTK